LSGKFTRESSFSSGDHRNFNRDGSAFDRGETFAGLDFEKGIEVAEELKQVFATGGEGTMAQKAIRWILDHPQISCVIPGASRPEQLHDNLAVSELPQLPAEMLERLGQLYEEKVKPEVHHRW
jgi:aryl-alcohol dehydrogenase-like predicted oxidoreductase